MSGVSASTSRLTQGIKVDGGLDPLPLLLLAPVTVSARPLAPSLPRHRVDGVVQHVSVLSALSGPVDHHITVRCPLGRVVATSGPVPGLAATGGPGGPQSHRWVQPGALPCPRDTPARPTTGCPAQHRGRGRDAPAGTRRHGATEGLRHLGGGRPFFVFGWGKGGGAAWPWVVGRSPDNVSRLVIAPLASAFRPQQESNTAM